jgi:hypothetical protein
MVVSNSIPLSSAGVEEETVDDVQALVWAGVEASE